MTQSKRRLKSSRLIRKEISEIFQKDFSARFSGALVTVSDVVMSPDLGFAKIYLSIFPVSKTDAVMEVLHSDKSKIRGTLGRRIGKEVRIVPEIAFFDDKTAEEAERMDKLIDALNIPEADEKDTDPAH